MEIVEVKTSDLTPYPGNPRRNEGAVSGVAESIRRFGFKQPLVIGADGVIVCGHTRYEAAKRLGLDTVPCVRADG
ncbi:MAG: ParB N-terminal domain-containing protein, partial [Thermoguttaceae bacterium]